MISPESHLNKRFELLGLAVSVPQAQWIGGELGRPYDMKFARSMQGKRFTSQFGGVLAEHSNRNVMNAWPRVAWNMLDGEDPENENWESRYAIDGCTDIPAICPSPLSGISICVAILTSTLRLQKGIWIAS